MSKKAKWLKSNGIVHKNRGSGFAFFESQSYRASWKTLGQGQEPGPISSSGPNDMSKLTDIIRARAGDGTAFPLICKIGALVDLHMPPVGLD